MWSQYCPACKTSFVPGIGRCSDCGGALQPRYEGDDEPPKDVQGSEEHSLEGPEESIERDAPLPPGTYGSFVHDVGFDTAEAIGRRLGEAGIPFVVLDGLRRGSAGFAIRVRAEDRKRAADLVDGMAPLFKADDGPALSDDGASVCPACGAAFRASMKECPGCGLGGFLEGDDEPSCRYCGRRLGDQTDRCGHCHRIDPVDDEPGG
jgi:hypothetical protein